MPSNRGIRKITMVCLLLASASSGCGYSKRTAECKLRELRSARTIERLEQNNRKHIRLPGSGRSSLLHFVRSGDPASPLKLLLIHGYPDSLLTWAELMQCLQEFDVYAIDLPGQGLTKARKLTESDLAPRGQAEYVLQFIREVIMPAQKIQDRCVTATSPGTDASASKLVIVGHSYGGLVACAAADQLDELSGLILIDPEGVPRTDSQFLPGERQFREGITGALSGCFSLAALATTFMGGWEEVTLTEYLQLSGGKIAPPPQRVREYSTLMRVPSNYRTNRCLVRRDSGKDRVNISAVGARMGTRTLILWGEWDELFPLESSARSPGHGRIFQHWFRGCTFVMIKRAGHLPHRENTEAVATSLLEFLTQLAATPLDVHAGASR